MRFTISTCKTVAVSAPYMPETVGTDMMCYCIIPIICETQAIFLVGLKGRLIGLIWLLRN
jgi:hypothetical protein